SMNHGGVFGAEGALLSLPSMCTTSVHSSSPSATVLVLSSAGLAQLRASQPLLLQKLLTAAYAQQQDYLMMTTRRSAVWTCGGWVGPTFDLSVKPPAASGVPALFAGECWLIPGGGRESEARALARARAKARARAGAGVRARVRVESQ
ncbi:MAG: hypothetical protein SGPRY_013268, partial [Prymnesium sp.]